MMNLSNFASLFPFRTLGSAQSSINTLLDNKDCTLDKLMDEQSFASEFKSQNPKLMQFLKYDKYRTLIEYVTKVGPEEDNKRTCKFPFVATEVLTTDNNTLVDYLLPEKELFIEEEKLEQIDVQEEVEVDVEDTDTQELPPLEPTATLMKPEESSVQDVQDTTETKDTQDKVEEEDQEEGIKVEEIAEEKESPSVEEGEEKKSEDESIEEEEERKPLRRIEKKIVKKEVVTKVKKQVQPLIGNLFQYLDEELNYTLAGYFSRVITSLFNKKMTSLTSYFFSEGRYLKLIKHIASRSIAELLVKLLTLDTCNYISEREEVLDQLLKQLSQPWGEDINTPVNLSFVLADVIEKSAAGVKTTQGAKEILSHIYTSKFCEQLLNNAISEVEQVAVYSAPVLLMALNSIRTLADNKEQCKNLELVEKYSELMTSLKFNLAKSSELSILFKDFLTKAVDRLDSEKSRSSTLGLGRIKLIESLFYMIKFDLFNLKSSIPETKLFERLFGLMKKYQMNNVLHNEIVKVITFILESDEGETLVGNLVQQGKIVSFLHEATLQDQGIQEEIANKKRGISRKGYIGHVVKMGQLLKKLSGNDNYLYIFDSKEWKAISKLIDKETYEAEKNLAGYSTKRGDVVSNIMFSKEDILALHHKFLSQPPVTTYPVTDDSGKDEIDEAIQMFEEKLRITESATTVPVALEVEVEDQTKEASKQQPEEQTPEHKKEQEKIIDDQREREESEGREINSLVSYWKDSKKMKFHVDDLMNEVN